MKSIVKVLRIALKYGGLVYTVVEVIQFALDKFENTKEYKQEIKN